ncbi:hypothetical protein [Trichormus azollae]|uniref:hypothetical protein n=1 Tax=Trichormus azollae TaxID=1164 RepID=UPI0002D289C4|nr:hypothetical protein [Trichormus azollae]
MVYLRRTVLGSKPIGVNGAKVYTQVVEFSQALTEPPLTPNTDGTGIFKVPHDWGI